MKNRWKDFHSPLSLAQVRLLYPPGIRPSPKVNISQQCFLCSTPQLPIQKKDLKGKGSGQRNGMLEKQKAVSDNDSECFLSAGESNVVSRRRVVQVEGCERLRWAVANTSFRNVYLDSCHESQAFKRAAGGTALNACCSNHNLWFWCASDGPTMRPQTDRLTECISNVPRALSNGKWFWNIKTFFINSNWSEFWSFKCSQFSGGRKLKYEKTNTW